MKPLIRKIMEIGFKCICLPCRYLPYKRPTVLFTSFGGQYNDNPRYISEKLHEIAPDINIIWAVSWKGKDILPDYVNTVRYNTLSYRMASLRCQVLVDNVIGYRWKFAESNDQRIKKHLCLKHQLNISTWHGTPIKRIGRYEYNLPGNIGFLSSADYLISGCQYTKARLEESFYPIPVELTGTPRNDILVNALSQKQILKIKIKLGLPEHKKIVLFAPTFRSNSVYSGTKQMSDFDVPRLLELLKKSVVKADCVFVYRVHHTVLQELERHSLVGHHDIIIDGNEHDDMAEYLAVTDVLITDYSGSIFDFALTGRPGFLYVPDKEHYINDERGINISLDELPYPSADNLTDFYKLIEDYDSEKAHKRIDEFNQRIGNAESGRASEIIAKQIIKFLETGEREV